MSQLPIINISGLTGELEHRRSVADQIHNACREVGFFYITDHGVDEALQERLETLSRRFFALPLGSKMEIRMALGGRAWRGYFPVGDELTSGQPDLKEGIYFGAELGEDHTLVKAGTPMHGAHLLPHAHPTVNTLAACRRSHCLHLESTTYRHAIPRNLLILRWSVIVLRQTARITHHHHSQRSETKGSIFIARNAGNKQANNATISNSNIVPIIIAGSVGLTP